MSGRSSKRKGYRIEKMCVDWFNTIGKDHSPPIRAKRGDGTVGEDVYVTIGVGEFRIECKGRRGGARFRTLLQWIVGSDALFLHADNQPSLIAIKPNALRDMLAEAYRAGRVSVFVDGFTIKEQVEAAHICFHGPGKKAEIVGHPIIKGVR